MLGTDNTLRHKLSSYGLPPLSNVRREVLMIRYGSNCCDELRSGTFSPPYDVRKAVKPLIAAHLAKGGSRAER
jgi:hypothetical protein